MDRVICTGEVRAVRTRSGTGEWPAPQTDTHVTYQVVEKGEESSLSGELWVKLVRGGVTGYESARIRDIIWHELDQGGWNACAGGGGWDGLFLPADSVAAILQDFRQSYDGKDR